VAIVAMNAEKREKPALTKCLAGFLRLGFVASVRLVPVFPPGDSLSGFYQMEL